MNYLKNLKKNYMVIQMNNNDFRKSFGSMEDVWRNYLSLFRSKPDLLIDMLTEGNKRFKLLFYQRMMMRIIFRYKDVYFTFTRGTAKSFTQVLSLYLKAMLYPNLKITLTAAQKNMSAQISQANIESIWSFIPQLKNELKEYRFEKDSTKLMFHNGSILSCVANNESSRGLRTNLLSVEEIIHERFDKDSYNEVLLPMMANDRIASCGGVDDNEIHKQTLIITTAGVKQSFAYDLQKEYLHKMAEGKSAFVIGADYELATSFGLLSLDFINEKKDSPTFNPISFMREYGSIWSGSSENSLVDLETFRKARVLKNAEDKAVSDSDVEYILAYDVARSEGSTTANSALIVIKLIPRGDGTYQKHIVNCYSMEGSHFLEQAKFLKQKVNDFRASQLIVDANGIGQGLIDQLILEIDENPSYAVVNDDRYKQFKKENSLPILYALKSSNKETKASDIHNLFINWINNGQVKFLESESQAKQRYQSKDNSRLAEKLRPYFMTDLLQEEIMNLEYKIQGLNTTVKQVSKSIQKDKFSALEYGLFYVDMMEKENKTRVSSSINISDFFIGRGAKKLI